MGRIKVCLGCKSDRSNWPEVFSAGKKVAQAIQASLFFSWRDGSTSTALSRATDLMWGLDQRGVVIENRRDHDLVKDAAVEQ